MKAPQWFRDSYSKLGSGSARHWNATAGTHYPWSWYIGPDRLVGSGWLIHLGPVWVCVWRTKP